MATAATATYHSILETGVHSVPNGVWILLRGNLCMTNECPCKWRLATICHDTSSIISPFKDLAIFHAMFHTALLQFVL